MDNKKVDGWWKRGEKTCVVCFQISFRHRKKSPVGTKSLNSNVYFLCETVFQRETFQIKTKGSGFPLLLLLFSFFFFFLSRGTMSHSTSNSNVLTLGWGEKKEKGRDKKQKKAWKRRRSTMIDRGNSPYSESLFFLKIKEWNVLKIRRIVFFGKTSFFSFYAFFLGIPKVIYGYQISREYTKKRH